MQHSLVLAIAPGNLTYKIFRMLLNERVVLCAWNTEFCHTSLAKLIVSASVIYGQHLLSFWESEISVREVPIQKKSGS